MNFIDMFLEYTKDAESPTSFFKWSAISALSAVMRDNVYFDAGYERIYPNTYILLVASSGACRKGSPLKIAQRLVQLTNNTKVISGRTSIQGAMTVLSQFETKSGIRGASALMYSEELSAFLVDDPAAIKILTDWYDFHETWNNSLVGGITTLNNVCVSLLGASNEHLLKDVYTDKANYGGLLARTFIVMEERRRHKNSRMFIQPEKYDPENLLKHLRGLARIKGPILFTEQAKQEYDDWYNAIEDEAYHSRSGVLERIHTGVLKLSMILASAEPEILLSNKIIVQQAHISQAIELCWGILRNYDMLLVGSQSTPVVHQMALVIRELRRAPNYQLSRKQLIFKLWYEGIDAPTLDNIITTMAQGGMLQSLLFNAEESYRLTEMGIEKILASVAGGKNGTNGNHNNGNGNDVKPRAAKFDS